MYKVVINEGLGFTEIVKEFENLKDATNYCLKFDIVRIYKGKKLIFKS